MPDEVAPEVCEAIRIVRGELDEERAVVGFCGAPFTVAGYLIEGKPSRDFAKVKAFMYREPDALARADGDARGLASRATCASRSTPAPT